MSSEQYGAVMDDDEVAVFLERQGVGTLSLGNETGGYGIPMSFGFDRQRDRCILQLSFDEESTKSKFIESGNRVSLSAFEWEDVDDWKSVVVRGALHEIPLEESSVAGGIFAAYSKIASPEVFRQPVDELDFEWYELRIDEVHGRKALE